MTFTSQFLLSAIVLLTASCKPRHFNSDSGTRDLSLSTATTGGTAAILAAANSAIGKKKVTDFMCADIVTATNMKKAMEAAKEVCEGINAANSDRDEMPAHLKTAYGAARCKPNQCEVLFSPTASGADSTLTLTLKVENKNKTETVRTQSTTNTFSKDTEGSKVEGTQTLPSFDGSPPVAIDVNSQTNITKNGNSLGGTNGNTQTTTSEVGQILSLEYRTATVDGVFMAACMPFGALAGQLIDACNERMANPNLLPQVKKRLEENAQRNSGN